MRAWPGNPDRRRSGRLPRLGLAGEDEVRLRLDPTGANVLASGIVASVTDGDTLRLADNRRIRLVQIDAPEVPRECYSEQALNELTRLAPVGVDVALRLDRALDAKDEHGRFLAYVTYGKKNLNLQLVELGAAAPYFFQARGQYAEDLMRQPCGPRQPDEACGARALGRTSIRAAP